MSGWNCWSGRVLPASAVYEHCFPRSRGQAHIPFRRTPASPAPGVREDDPARAEVACGACRPAVASVTVLRFVVSWCDMSRWERGVGSGVYSGPCGVPEGPSSHPPLPQAAHGGHCGPEPERARPTLIRPADRAAVLSADPDERSVTPQAVCSPLPGCRSRTERLARRSNKGSGRLTFPRHGPRRGAENPRPRRAVFPPGPSLAPRARRHPAFPGRHRSLWSDRLDVPVVRAGMPRAAGESGL